VKEHPGCERSEKPESKTGIEGKSKTKLRLCGRNLTRETMANKFKKEAREAREANRKLKMCESKRAYATEAEATVGNQKTYQCDYCQKWHRSGAFTTLVRTLQNRAEKKR
jgi:hypothetical protein